MERIIIRKSIAKRGSAGAARLTAQGLITSHLASIGVTEKVLSKL